VPTISKPPQGDHYVALQMAVQTSAIRVAQFMQQEYTVVPVVAMIEGVRFGGNQDEPELGLAAEFGKFPQSWDGRPVTTGHPMVDGVFVYANQPQILETHQFGFIANTELDSGKLKMEAWLNKSRAETLPEAQDVFDRIDGGEEIEVSVGFFCEVDETEGEYEGIPYSGVWRNIVPDHLAFLAVGVPGACSVADGCGVPKVNQGTRFMTLKTTKASEPPTQCSCGNKGHTNADPNTQQEMRVYEIAPGALDRDIRNGIQDALRKRHPGVANYDIYVVGFTSEVAVYEQYVSGMGYKHYQIAFSSDENGKVTFSGDPVEVSIVSKIVPQDSPPSGGTVSDGNQPTTQSANPEGGSSSDEGNQMANENKDSNTPQPQPGATGGSGPGAKGEKKPTGQNPSGTTDPAPATPARDSTNEGNASTTTQQARPQLTAQQYIEQAPPEIREMLDSGVRMHQARKAEVIQQLKDTGRCKFSDDYLRGQSLETLEQLAELAKVPTYTGRPNPTAQQSTETDAPPPAPVAFPALSADELAKKRAERSQQGRRF
jgi:hypothetical protein